MATFYFLALLVTGVCAVWLWRAAPEAGRLLRVLAGVAVWWLALAILRVAGVLPESPPMPTAVLLLLVAWAGLLWGMGLDWRGITAVLVGALALAFWPAFPLREVASWGFITAVPMIVLLYTLPPFSASSASGSETAVPEKQNGHIVARLDDPQQQILDFLSDGILISDQAGTITYVNQTAVRLLGMPAAKLEGQPVTDILTRLPLLSPAGEAGKPGRFEVNGRYLQGQAQTIFDRQGVAQGIITTLHDITTEYQAEQAKDGFLQTVSHELRTPLTAIKGYVELLSTGTGGPLTDNQKKFTDVIQRNVTHMVHLINSLIFASSVKGGRMEYTVGRADLARLIRQISREMEPQAVEDEQQIRIDIHPQLQPIQADPIHMATILEELVKNAIKYNRRGGQVTIKAAPKAAQNEAQAFAVVSVKDEGIGIDPEDQSHIFEEFFRPEHSDAQIKAGGMGMGLSIVRALVEAYNGRIWFESMPQKGSTFTFIIPTNQPEQLTDPTTSLPTA